MEKGDRGEYKDGDRDCIKKKLLEPYAVKSILIERGKANPNTGKSIYLRYTKLAAENDAPEIFKKTIEECNRRAERAIEKYKGSGETYAYITTVTRADDVAFSLLETEYEVNTEDAMKGREVSYKFKGSTFDMDTGKEIPLSEIITDKKNLSEMLKKALKTGYGTDGLAGTEPFCYAWTADALGIRFLFNSNAASKEKRKEIGDNSDDVITAGLPYDKLDGLQAEKLSKVPEAYIARADRETVYAPSYGDFSFMLTKDERGTVIRIMPNKGKESSLIIENADSNSDFYIIRSKGGFYLFRENIGYQEGFFYDFSNPDGGFGRFGYNTSQYFDSFMREIGLALPYNPYCVHMAEVRRSFGEMENGTSYFVPHGHYLFPDDSNSRYKHFMLIDNALQIDTLNTAYRLLKDMNAVEVDNKGKELKKITIKAGLAIVFESVRGEADRYQIPTKRGRNNISYTYNCCLADGKKVSISSNTEHGFFVNGEYLNRFSEPVSLAEAKTDIKAPKMKAFTVKIGGKIYPVIPDYSKPNHTGEEIDFGKDIWWKAEGYVGGYEISDDDILDMQKRFLTDSNKQADKDFALLNISKDGKIRFDYYGEVYEGVLPDKRYYGVPAGALLQSKSESRSFKIIPRRGNYHTVPFRIEFYSAGLPATNSPSAQPPISVYLTKKGK